MLRGIATWDVFIPNEAFLVAKSALGPHGAKPRRDARAEIEHRCMIM